LGTQTDKREIASAASARRRPARTLRARRSTLRASRALVLSVAGIGVLIFSFAAFGVAAGSTRPSTSVASGYVTRVGNAFAGVAAVTASLKSNTAEVSAPAAPPALDFTGGSTTVSSQVVARVLTARATTTLADVSLLEGLVTATSVTVVAQATVGGGAVAATTSGSAVSGLTVAGQAVTTADRPIVIDGVGTLTVLIAASEASGDSSSAQTLGLRLVLSAPWRDLPAGSVLVAGQASATADRATLDALAPLPRPTASPTTRPSPTPTTTATQPAQTTQDAPPVQQQTYAPMPAPQSAPSGLLAFPGAVFPVTAPYNYIDDWHAPRIGHLHQGNDIFAAWGTPLLAVQDGVIGWMSDYGLGGISLHLTNAAGDYFYYAHLSRYAKGLRDGQHVAAGEIIAYVGNTGDAATTPSHLHFEIHPQGGAPVDPFPYLELWRAGATAPVTLSALPPTPPPGAPQTAPRPRKMLLALAPGPAATASHSWFERLPSLFPAASDSSPTFPLVVLIAVGTAVVKRIQWMKGPF
jgi:murein DD-endopeptidase MepM/ murein hydrolase activator NlpD